MQLRVAPLSPQSGVDPDGPLGPDDSIAINAAIATPGVDAIVFESGTYRIKKPIELINLKNPDGSFSARGIHLIGQTNGVSGSRFNTLIQYTGDSFEDTDQFRQSSSLTPTTLGAKVSSTDGGQDTQPASNAVDGDPNTAWQSARHTGTLTWLQADCGAPAPCDGFRVHQFRPDTDATHFARDWKVQGSNSALHSDWTDLTVVAGTTRQDYAFQLPATVTYRYYRWITGRTDPNLESVGLFTFSGYHEVQNQRADACMLKIYSSDNVIDGLCFMPAPGKRIFACVRVTQGTSPAGMTENQFRHCYFGTPGGSNWRYDPQIAKVTHGVVMADNLDYGKNDNGPFQCDFCTFVDCTFRHVNRACVFNPNQSGQSNDHRFERCRFGPAAYAFRGYKWNFKATECVYANLSNIDPPGSDTTGWGRDASWGAVACMDFWLYSSAIRGGSSENVRALVEKSLPVLPMQGIVAGLTIQDFRFFVAADFPSDGTFVIDFVAGGPLLMLGLMFSGQYRANIYISARNPWTLDPVSGKDDMPACPLIAIGCSFPNRHPFRHSDNAGAPYRRTVEGCTTVRPDGTALLDWFDDGEFTTPPERAKHVTDALHDMRGLQLVSGTVEQVVQKLDDTAGLAATVEKLNRVIEALTAHGLLRSIPSPLQPLDGLG